MRADVDEKTACCAVRANTHRAGSDELVRQGGVGWWGGENQYKNDKSYRQPHYQPLPAPMYQEPQEICEILVKTWLQVGMHSFHVHIKPARVSGRLAQAQ